jgi:hypothetical protein
MRSANLGGRDRRDAHCSFWATSGAGRSVGQSGNDALTGIIRYASGVHRLDDLGVVDLLG